MSARPLRELVHPSWAQALAPVESVVAGLGEFLRAEVAAGRGYLPAGPHAFVWDGRDDAGRPVPSGFYLARLASEGSVVSRKLMLVK